MGISGFELVLTILGFTSGFCLYMVAHLSTFHPNKVPLCDFFAKGFALFGISVSIWVFVAFIWAEEWKIFLESRII